MSDDMARAFRAGWKSRDASISIVQPTNARDEFYGTPKRTKATVRPMKYHASIFTRWLKEQNK
jgi:hypothetical protein